MGETSIVLAGAEIMFSRAFATVRSLSSSSKASSTALLTPFKPSSTFALSLNFFQRSLSINMLVLILSVSEFPPEGMEYILLYLFYD